jgi:hypothetical protein
VRTGSLPPQSRIRPWYGVGELAEKLPVVLDRYAQHKRCWLCKEWLPLADFGVDQRRPDGLAYADRVCLSLYRVELKARKENRRATCREAQRRYQPGPIRRPVEPPATGTRSSSATRERRSGLPLRRRRWGR